MPLAQNKKVKYLILLLTYTGLIIYLSCSPLNKFPHPRFPLWDKLSHFLIYFLLALTALKTFLLYGLGLRNSAIGGFLYAFLLGFILEAIQAYLPFRSFEFLDVAANTAGSISAVFFYSFYFA